MSQNLYSSIDMTKVMFGNMAIRVPMWMVVQDQAFIGGSLDPALKYGSEKIHQLIVGEMIVRPHIVVASNAFSGHGISSFLTDNPSVDEWLENGKIVYMIQQGLTELEKWR